MLQLSRFSLFQLSAQLVDVRKLEDVRGIVARRRTIAAENAGIVPIQTSPAVVICVVDGLRVSVGALDHQAIPELAIDRGLQGIVIRAQKALP